MDKTIQDIYEEVKKQVYEHLIFNYAQDDVLKFYHECLEGKEIEYTYKKMSPEKLNSIDKWRDMHRTMVGLIMENDKGKDKELQNSNYYQKKLDQLVSQLFDGYNNFRNLYDQHKTKIYGDVLIYDKQTNTIRKNKEYSEKELYNRVIHKFSNKQVLANEKYKIIFEIVSGKQVENMKIIERLIDINYNESELKENVDFGDFKYYDLIVFCAVLDYACIIQMAKNILNQKGKKCLYIPKQEMVETISKLTNIRKSTIAFFVDCFTYNRQYQERHYTLFQPLFNFDDEIFISPSVIINSLLPMKLIRVIQDTQKYKQVFSKIASIRETQMIELLKKLLKRENTEIVVNYQMNRDAEYDILLLDNKANSLWIIECKWFNLADNEREHAKLHRKLKETIKYRKEKNQILISNLQQNVSNIFSYHEKIENVYELIVSQNDMGTCSDEQMPIVDFDTLENILKVSNGNFEAIWEIIVDKKYIPRDHIKLITSKTKLFDYNFETEFITISKTFLLQDFIKKLLNSV